MMPEDEFCRPGASSHTHWVWDVGKFEHSLRESQAGAELCAGMGAGDAVRPGPSPGVLLVTGCRGTFPDREDRSEQR